MRTGNLLYHYTNLDYIQHILACAYLKPSNGYVSLTRNANLNKEPYSTREGIFTEARLVFDRDKLRLKHKLELFLHKMYYENFPNTRLHRGSEQEERIRGIVKLDECLIRVDIYKNKKWESLEYKDVDWKSIVGMN